MYIAKISSLTISHFRLQAVNSFLHAYNFMPNHLIKFHQDQLINLGEITQICNFIIIGTFQITYFFAQGKGKIKCPKQVQVHTGTELGCLIIFCGKD